ncbi:tetratricopeptide repeat protein [Saccharothrix sp. 6-C]|uniref:alpha/beta hydrolase n=1 Tax=Saccharothrix sp. 6-C TaxID=2781735 RepID=UPI00191730ED|nr:alpha/beta fold hydrolase [Saccharothrix sp. 6-C]QQQ74272.1 tetratricopeptide repeat protein [Saccharothrix sp. 6-C]
MARSEPVDAVFVHGLFSAGRTWDRFAHLVATDPDFSGRVRTHLFEYPSPRFSFRPDRRIATADDIADRLGTYLRHELGESSSILLVTHSQGGLITQRFLARTLWRGEGESLARIKQVVMFACPNDGSEFFLGIRKWWYPNNPQEAQLRPFDTAIVETQRTLFRAVVNATGVSESTCRIPIAAYGGLQDRIVPPRSSAWLFHNSGMVDGDHFSIIQPEDSASSSYRVLRGHVLDVLNQGGAPSVATSETVVEKPDAGRPAVSVTPRLDGLPKLYGRSKLVASIVYDRQSKVHVLGGIGGSGKSRIALEVAARAKKAGHRVWWIEVPRINLSMREVANQLGAPRDEAETAWYAGPRSAADLLWRLLDATGEPWLLVFDNADDPQLLDPTTKQVSDGTGWLRKPASPHGRVLVTSRDRSRATWGDWATVHAVPPLDPDDGASMLTERVPDGGTSQEARDLAVALGGLPLALHAAAQYLNAVIRDHAGSGPPSITGFRSYRAAFELRLKDTGGSDSESLGLGIVAEVFILSLDLLAARRQPWAASLLKLLACFQIAPIPYHMLFTSLSLTETPLLTDFEATSDQDYLPALDALADLGLVELQRVAGVADPDLGRMLTLHPLVHSVMRQDQDVLERRDDYYGLDIEMLLAATAVHDPDQPESWTVWNKVITHSVELTKAYLLGGPPPTDRRLVAAALRLAKSSTRYLIATGILNPGSDLVESLIANCGRFRFDQDDPEILGLRHERGRIALERDQPLAAEEELAKVVAARQRVLGDDDPDTLASMHKHAKAIAEQGRWAEAEPLLRRIVDAEQTVRGPEHSDMMVVKHSLARTVLALKRAPEAERMLRDILEVRLRLWSGRHPETLSVRRTLANSLLAQGELGRAEAELADALRVVADDRHAREALALRYSLCLVRVSLGTVEEKDLAILVDDQAKAYGSQHPVTNRTRRLLARLRRELRPSARSDDASLE